MIQNHTSWWASCTVGLHMSLFWKSVPQCNLLISLCNFVPCDQVVQKAFSWYTRIYCNGRQGRDITWSNSSLSCTCHYTNLRDRQSNRRCNQKCFTDSLAYISSFTREVFTTWQCNFQHTLRAKSTSNQHDEVANIRLTFPWELRTRNESFVY